jgi:hypothetical protein
VDKEGRQGMAGQGGGADKRLKALYRAHRTRGRDEPGRRLASDVMHTPPQRPTGGDQLCGRQPRWDGLGRGHGKARWSEQRLSGSSSSTQFTWHASGLANGEGGSTVDQDRS